MSCWGENNAGQLGDGSTSDRRVPVAVVSGTTFTSIAAGSGHTCGVTAGGEAYCWGQNFNGQLGDGTTVNRTTPVHVRSTAHFVSIAAGGTHTCAVADDGAAYCWGRNAYGQLGTGRTVDEWTPTIVADGHVFASLRAFGSHTCGVTVTGEPFCWGYNVQYQLGDGTRTNRLRPVRVKCAVADDEGNDVERYLKSRRAARYSRNVGLRRRDGVRDPAPRNGTRAERGRGRPVEAGCRACSAYLRRVQNCRRAQSRAAPARPQSAAAGTAGGHAR